MTARRTIVVHTTLSGHMIRVDAARSAANGVQVMTMGQSASRLAGGFLQPIDAETLREAVRMALADSTLGEFDVIKDLSGMAGPPSARSTKSGARTSTSQRRPILGSWRCALSKPRRFDGCHLR